VPDLGHRVGDREAGGLHHDPVELAVQRLPLGGGRSGATEAVRAERTNILPQAAAAAAAAAAGAVAARPPTW
jgi:hypothetical protein